MHTHSLCYYYRWNCTRTACSVSGQHFNSRRSYHAEYSSPTWNRCSPVAIISSFSWNHPHFEANQQHKWFDNHKKIIGLQKNPHITRAQTPTPTHMVKTVFFHSTIVITLKRMAWNVHISMDELYIQSNELISNVISFRIWPCVCVSWCDAVFSPFCVSFGLLSVWEPIRNLSTAFISIVRWIRLAFDFQ